MSVSNKRKGNVEYNEYLEKKKKKTETQTNTSHAVAIIRPEVTTRSCVKRELLNLRQMKPTNSVATSYRGPSPKFDKGVKLQE